jgi:ankyrin repeat protein/WD40 repeat protein
LWLIIRKDMNSIIDPIEKFLSDCADGNTEKVMAWLTPSVSKAINLAHLDYLGNAPLHIVCEKGHLQIAQMLIDAGALVNAENDDEMTPLFIALINGHAEMVGLLVSHGADIGANKRDEINPVKIALKNKDEAVVLALMDAGAKVSLVVAVEQGLYKVVERLIRGGADVNQKNKDGDPLLYIAAKSDLTFSIAELLLKNGASVNSTWTSSDSSIVSSALANAASNGAVSVVRLLLEHGANVNLGSYSLPINKAATDDKIEIIDLLLQYGADVNVSNRWGSALHDATRSNQLNAVQFLVQHGADLSYTDSFDGSTALGCALKNGHSKIVQVLIEAGAKFPFDTPDKNELFIQSAGCGCLQQVEYLIHNGAGIDICGTPAILQAAKNGHTSVVEFLLQAGVNVCSADNEKDTSLHLAAKNGHLPVVNLLLCNGADVNAANNYGETPLHLSAENGHLEVAKQLISNGAEIDCETNNEELPILRAASYGHTKIVSLILGQYQSRYMKRIHCARALLDIIGNSNSSIEIVTLLIDETGTVEFCNEKQESLLYRACRTGRTDFVELLLAKGASTETITSSGETPLMAAVRSGHSAVAKRLFQAGADLFVRDTKGNSLLHKTQQLDIIAWLLANGAAVNAVNHYGKTPLFNAVEALVSRLSMWVNQSGPDAKKTRLDLPAVVLTLLNAHADPNIPDNEGITPLLIALKKDSFDAAGLLIEYGANVSCRDENNRTALESAIIKRRTGLVHEMALRGMGFQISGVEGHRAISFAMERNSVSLVRILIKKGINPNIRDAFGRTPLHWAAERGCNDLAAELLKIGADLDLKDNAGETPLFGAIKTSNHELVRLFLAESAAVNIVNVNGDSPVNLAIARNDKVSLKHLIEKGAAINTKNNRGETPCSFALELGDAALIDILFRAGGDIKPRTKIEKRRPAAKEKHYHQIIARYFDSQPHFFNDQEKEFSNKRKCIELPWQQISAEMWDGITQTLSDLWFLESKIQAGLLSDLHKDYSFALESLPENKNENDIKKKHKKEVEFWRQEVIRFSKTKVQAYPILRCEPPLTIDERVQKYHAEIQNPSFKTIINHFFNFLKEKYDSFNTLNLKHPVICLALDHGDVGLVHDAAQSLVQATPAISYLKRIKEKEELPSSLVLSRNKGIQDGFNGRLCYDLSLDGTVLVYTSGTEQGSMCIKVLDIESNSTINSNEKYSYINQLNLTSAKKNIAVSDNSAVKVVDAKSLSTQHELSFNRLKSDLDWKPSDFMNEWIQFSPDGETLWIWGSKFYYGWKWKNDEVSFKLRLEHPWYIVKVDAILNIVLIQQYNNFNDALYQIRELQTNQLICEFKWDIDLSCDYSNPCEFITNTQLLVYVKDKGLFLINTGNINNKMNIYEGAVKNFHLSLSKRYLCLSTESGLVKIWDLLGFVCLIEFPASAKTVYLSPDAQRLVFSSDAQGLMLCNLFDGVVPIHSPVHNGPVLSSVSTRDGRLNVTSGHGGSGATGANALWHVGDSNSIIVDKRQTGYNERALALSTDNQTLVTADGVWSLSGLRKLSSLTKCDRIFSSFMSSDGRKAVVCGKDQSPAVLDLSQPDKITNLAVEPVGIVFFTMALSQDNRYLAVGTYTKQIYIWDFLTLKLIQTLTGHDGAITSLCFSTTGKKIISATGGVSNFYWQGFDVPTDSIIRVWDLLTGACDCVLTGHQGPVRCLRVLHNKKILLSACDGGFIKQWDMTTWECIKTISTGHPISNIHIINETVAIAQTRNGLSAYDLADGLKITTIPIAGITHTNISGGKILVGKDSGHIEFYELFVNGSIVKSSNNPLPTESVRLWERDQEFPNGKWSDRITSVCNYCGALFTTPSNILDIIKQINKDNQVGPDDSPCLKLPDEAWDEPKLLFECPKCGGKLKSNPFVVDNKERFE